MEEFKIDKNPKAPTVLVIFLMIITFSGVFSIFIIGIFGLVFALGGIRGSIIYYLILKGVMQKKELVIDDNGLRFYRGDDLIQDVEWSNVSKVESFDQAHNDFVFKLIVKEGLHFIPDPYFFHADDMRNAYEKVKEATDGMDLEFVEHDVRFA